MEHVESGVALIALRSGVPMIPLYIGGKPRLFRRLDVRVGDPIAMDDLRERGVNRETCEELLARITETYRALTGTPGGVNTKICVKSWFFRAFFANKKFFQKNCRRKRKIRRYVEQYRGQKMV